MVRSPSGRGRRRSQAESRPQLRFRTMLRAGDSDPDPTLGGPGPLPGPSPLTLSPDCRRTFLPPLLVRWAGPARGKGRGWLPPCAREEGRGHSWATSGPSTEGPNGTEGRLSSRAGRGRHSFFSPRGAWRISGGPIPQHMAGTRGNQLGAGMEFDTGAFSLRPRVPPCVWLRWLNSFRIFKDGYSGPSPEVHPGAAPVPWPASSRGKEASLGRGSAKRGSEDVPYGRWSPRPLSRNPGHRAEGAPLRVPDARMQPPPALACLGFPFRAPGTDRAQSPTPRGCPRGSTREPRVVHRERGLRRPRVGSQTPAEAPRGRCRV